MFRAREYFACDWPIGTTNFSEWVQIIQKKNCSMGKQF